MRLRYIEGIPGKLDLQVWTDLSSMEQFTLTVINGYLEMPGVLIDDERGVVELVGYDGLYYHSEGWAAVLLSNGRHHVVGRNRSEVYRQYEKFNRASLDLGTHERVVLVEARDDVACWGCRSAMRDPGRPNLPRYGLLEVGWVDKDEGPFAIYHDRCKDMAPFGHRLVPHKKDSNEVLGTCSRCGGQIKRSEPHEWVSATQGGRPYHRYCT